MARSILTQSTKVKGQQNQQSQLWELGGDPLTMKVIANKRKQGKNQRMEK